MKQYLKSRYIVLGMAIVVFCFVPMINMPYEVIVQKQVEEEYTTVEPYTVIEGVTQPYQSWEPYYDSSGDMTVYEPVTRLRKVTKEVTKYREVTKTRLVTQPVVETRTKRVSVLRYLLR